MTITAAVRKVLRENEEASLGNTGILYSEVCRVLGVTEPSHAPNPGSVYRIWRRHRYYAVVQRRDRN